MRKITVVLILCFLGPVKSQGEDWYIPKPVDLISAGAVEVGTRFSFAVNGDGVLESSRLENGYWARYSPLSRLELYFQVPLVYARQERFDNLLNIVESSAFGLGDIFSQVSYEGFSGEDWKLIYNLDVSVPTGKNPYENRVGLGGGHYSLGLGQMAVKIVDPVALFGYIGYQHSLAGKYPIGKVQPGGDLRFKLGSAIVLNPRIRTSLYVTGDIVGKVRINGRRLAGSSSNLVYFGWGTDWSTGGFKVNVDAVFGMTKVTPDAAIIAGCSLPI
ncbi:MAG: hypothetical protein FD189_386 [Elusimicrobia bacterium]|nr:MAG: hypothetical protein FD154_466 [Elusimicrobiota bacterium]KAF0157865.1 MAG: hypothetical protein FD189_386 [Elusimicrobiota bacterium]